MTTAALAATPSAAVIDAAELRQVLGSFVTGVTVITTVDAAGRCYGLTVNSFTSVSLNPPLILWNQSVHAPSHPVFRDAKRFAVNILAEDQVDISKRFSGSAVDKFAGVATQAGLGGVPLIDGCTAYLECSSEAAFPGGDHAVFLGRVERIERRGRKPLVFGQGRYLTAQVHEYSQPLADTSLASHAQLQAVRMATPVLVDLSRQFDRSMALSVWGSHGPTVVRWEQPARDPLNAQLPAGQVCALLTSATGLCWAAHVPAALSAPLLEAELAVPADAALHTGVDHGSNPAGRVTRADAEQLLASVRQEGAARVVGSDNFTERYGTRINALAVPVFDAQGRMAVSFTLVGAADSLDIGADSAACRQLTQAAAALSRQLGHTGDGSAAARIAAGALSATAEPTATTPSHPQELR